jgi:hypothetical protein
METRHYLTTWRIASGNNGAVVRVRLDRGYHRSVDDRGRTSFDLGTLSIAIMVRSSPCHIVGQHTIHRARGTRQCVPLPRGPCPIHLGIASEKEGGCGLVAGRERRLMNHCAGVACDGFEFSPRLD